jgi:hypothetical protein
MSAKELDAFQIASLEIARAQLKATEALVEAQVRTNELAAAANRQGEDETSHVDARLKRSEDDNARIAAARTQEFHRIEFPQVLSKVANEPTVTLRCTLDCIRLGSTEERPGARRVIRLLDVDFAEGIAAIRADIGQMFEAPRKEAKRLGDEVQLRSIEATIDGRGARGVQFRAASEVHMPAVRRLVGHYLEDLLEVGTVRLVATAPATAAAE